MGANELVAEKYSFQSGDSVFRLAVTSVLWMCLMAVAMLLAAVLISVLRGKSSDFGMLVHVTLVTSVVMAAFMFLFLFLSERIARSLYGEKRSDPCQRPCSIAWLRWPSFQQSHCWPTWRVRSILWQAYRTFGLPVILPPPRR